MGVARLTPPPRRIRAGVTQLLFSAAGIAGGIAAVNIHTDPGVPATRAAELLLAIGFGILGVASVIFSLLFLVVQWAASTFTPRLTLFRDDPVVWRTFAFVIGVFTFCLATVLSMGRRETISAIVPSIAVLLVLIALVLIRNLHAKAFNAIELGPSLTAIATRGQEILRQLHDAPSSATPAALPPSRVTVRWPGGVCVLQQLDLRKALKIATAAGSTIVIRQQVGATLRTGIPVADIHPAASPAAGASGARDESTPVGPPAHAVLALLVVGAQRTFGQDPMLAFRLLADIALRALSTAVNDPATAVQTLDFIHQLLAEVMGHPRYTGELTDQAGTVRLKLSLPTWADYLSTGVGDVIAAAGHSQMVLRRIHDLLTDLNNSADPVHRQELRRWITEVSALRHPVPGPL